MLEEPLWAVAVSLLIKSKSRRPLKSGVKLEVWFRAAFQAHTAVASVPPGLLRRKSALSLHVASVGLDPLENDPLGAFGAIHGQAKCNIVGGADRLCVVHGYLKLTTVQSGRQG